MVVDDVGLKPPLYGLCALFERGKWRSERLAEHLMEWLPDFALSADELADLGPETSRRLLRKAALTLYRTNKFGRRGEFGELLLHAVLCQHFNTAPAIRKIYFKDAPNDTVKGFDAVHVTDGPDGLELWLGEVKFYEDLNAATRDVAKELRKHSSTEYLRTEFAAIINKLHQGLPQRERVTRLLHDFTTLDQVFARVRIPVLLTYDSPTTGSHTVDGAEYRQAIAAELRQAHADFVRVGYPNELTVNLVLVPLATKKSLVTALHSKLEGLQR